MEHYKNKDLNDLPGEEWRAIPEWDNYMISNLGRVKSLERIQKVKLNGGEFFAKKKTKILSQGLTRSYLTTCLTTNGIGKTHSVHRLVAKSFIDNFKNKPDVNHINGIKSDNRFDNLEWVTESENSKHAVAAGLIIGRSGEKNANSKKVLQFDLQGYFIKQWNCISEASKELNVPTTNISKCCIGRKHSKTAGGYKWLYKDKPKEWQRPSIA